jgi:hypothetical protein
MTSLALLLGLLGLLTVTHVVRLWRAFALAVALGVFALHAAGRTRIVAVERKLDEVNESIQDVLSGQVAARIVFRL